MIEQLVTYDTAQLAQAKGFDEYCRHTFSRALDGPDFWLPTQDLLERWLREKHNLVLQIGTFIIGDNWKTGYIFYRVERINAASDRGPEVQSQFETYEFAREAALYHALTLLP